jgi:hypothetical protein
MIVSRQMSFSRLWRAVRVEHLLGASGRKQGQPRRIRHLDDVLAHICARHGVWRATGRESSTGLRYSRPEHVFFR